MGLFFRRDGGEPAIEKGRFRHGQRQQTLCGGNQLVPRTYEKDERDDSGKSETGGRRRRSDRREDSCLQQKSIIDDIVRDKTRIVALNKIDLADGAQTESWKRELTAAGTYAIPVNCNTGAGINQIFRRLDLIREERERETVRRRPLRLMIVGVPNVGEVIADQ